jgi:hypothetical protein
MNQMANVLTPIEAIEMKYVLNVFK